MNVKTLYVCECMKEIMAKVKEGDIDISDKVGTVNENG